MIEKGIRVKARKGEFLYKCRLCNDITCVSFEDVAWLWKYVHEGIRYPNDTIPGWFKKYQHKSPNIFKEIYHKCGENQMGVADLVGLNVE